MSDHMQDYPRESGIRTALAQGGRAFFDDYLLFTRTGEGRYYEY